MPKIKFMVSFDRGESWIEKESYEIVSPVVTIGRSPIADIKLLYANNFLSKIHCTLFNYPDVLDLEIMDGTLLEATMDDAETGFKTSAAGTVVNLRRLEPGEKIKLKNNDEITLVRGILKFIYIRQPNKEIDKLDETFVPEEYQS